jgi:NitT/TauT family transport system ATP-binding protein
MLTSSPTTVAEDLTIDLPADRDRLGTRSDPLFTELRGRAYAQIQKAKQKRQ